MTCSEVLELLTEYLEGALSAAEHARVNDHLDGCDHCRRDLAQLEASISATGALRQDAVPDHVRESLVRAFRGYRRIERPEG